MTTEAAMTPKTTPGRTPGNPPRPGGAASPGPVLVAGLRILAIAAASAAVVGGLVVAIAAMSSGGEAFRAALIGTGIAVGVFAFGAFSVHVAAGIMPSAAMLVALVTYAGQLVLVFAIFIAMSRPGGPADGPQRGWLAAAVIACTLAWLVVQIVATTRQRTPLYDLAEEPGRGSSQAGHREGER